MPDWQAGPPTELGGKTALGAGGVGMLAERVVLPEGGIVAIPDHLSFEEAATLPCAAVTAWHALFEGSGVRVQAGDTVLVQGTGGGLDVRPPVRPAGRCAGDRHLKQRSQARPGPRDGSHPTGSTTRPPPTGDVAARSLTDGRGGRPRLSRSGGSGTLPRSINGRSESAAQIALIGLLTGAGEVRPPIPLLMKSIRLQGIFVGSRA